MTKNQEKIAIEYIKWWFNNKADGPRPYRDTVFGKFLKDILIREGRWKNAPRSNPRKAYKRMQEILTCKRNNP